jgi:2-polyprenyl-3-methyl-5-hydroxy-6-metoxy-1,4-benzoquinol methylase
MKVDYSKPSSDISVETTDWQQKDKKTLQSQKTLAKVLIDQEKRRVCLLCGESIEKAYDYSHRDVDYKVCSNCNHLQSAYCLPKGYPHEFLGRGFETIYPKLDNAAYESRRDRIYLPKLDWALGRMEELGISKSDAIGRKWFEFGCGAGYFLDALHNKGAKAICGIDENEALVNLCKERMGDDVADVSRDLFSQLDQSDADVLVSFFVLEHIEEAKRLWEILRSKPTGTMFLFAVPTFGFSAILEGTFDGFAARSLDSAVHTQLYTDQSIDYALENAGYDKAGEWIFGQDSSDLFRLLYSKMSEKMPDFVDYDLKKRITEAVDGVQHILDKNRLSDARHILAIRR